MNKKLYNLMDWAEIEAVTYSEEDHPKKLLGPHSAGRSGTLIQAYFPEAKSVAVKADKVKEPYPMEMMDESGYFAVLLRKKIPFHYVYEIVNKDGKKLTLEDPYAYPQVISDRNSKKFRNGILRYAWETLGSHIVNVEGKEGVHFAVWAPDAMRVSVVGDFNDWDGRIYEMEKLPDESGIFEIFIPGLKEGALYKYEIKAANGTVTLKTDPYGYRAEEGEDPASIVTDINSFNWTDEDWMAERHLKQDPGSPMVIYELELSSFNEKKQGFKAVASELSRYLKENGYTHVELMPVMEYKDEASAGYHTYGFYAPAAKYGSPEDLFYFMDHMHKEGIGVILDWSPAHFDARLGGLVKFDGTCIYESSDSRRSFHPDEGTLTFDFARPEVKNFLLSNALFWTRIYHADALRADNTASMLYLDYGREDYLPNIYGGKENTDAVELLQSITNEVHKEKSGVIMIAEDNSAWPGMTTETGEGGLGFDYKWNESWRDDFLTYLSYDPFYRTEHYGELCFSLVYAYAERFMLPMTHDAFNGDKGSFIAKMPGNREEKYANLKASLGFMFTYPGKKIIDASLTLGDEEAWAPGKCLDRDLLKKNENKEVHDLIKDLSALYKERPALHELSMEEAGFEWINCISANENILVFMRKGRKESDTLIVVVNFENIPRKNYKIGVPKAGKYKEIFNTDAEKYGGFDFRNSHVLKSDKDECDGREDSIRIKVPPLAVTVFEVQG